MKRQFIRYLIVSVLCALVAGSVMAQQPNDGSTPKDSTAQQDYEQAQSVEASGNYDEAVKLFGQVIDREPDFWQAYYKRGEAYSIQEKYELAVEDYSHVIDLQPDFALAYVARGVAYEQIDDHSHALDDSNKAIELGTSDDYVYFNRGQAHLGLLDFEKAIADFTYWIDLNPKTYAVAYYYRSRAYYAVSNLPGMVDDLDIFIELQPESPSVLADRAYIHRLLGNYDNAISDYSKAIDLKPEGVERVYYERGETYGLQGDYNKMLADLRAYAKLAGDQTDPVVLDLLKNHPE